MALVEPIAGLTVAIAVFRSSWRETTAWSAWFRRIEAVFFMGGITLTAILHFAADVHLNLNETLFAVAATHLQAFVLFFAVLRGFDSAPQRRLGWIGVSFAAFGGNVFGYGCMILGRHGMPIGYVDYR